MRIIAGQHRGRKLIAPRDDDVTRPITDRVKQSTFDLLAARDFFNGGHVLDLFSGTGSLGIEALSRGAEACTFVDQNADVIRRLQNNLESLGLVEQAHVYQQSVTSMLWMSSALRQGPATIAFVDPPYAMMRDAGDSRSIYLVIRKLANLIATDGIIALRLPDDIDAQPVDGLELARTERFGSMTMNYYRLPLDD